jgi:FHS family glucose/mannose:H+ symporter-like MFS transporter
MYKRKLVFWCACIGILFFGICLITLGAVVPGIKEKFQLDEISSGTLFSILPFGILVGSLVFGPFCDRYGYKILLALSCFLMFVGFEGIAYAPSHILLKVCIFLFGAGGGSVNGATNALVSDISKKDKGADLSLLGVFFGLGALGMPFILGVLESRFNYDVVVSIVGFATLALGIFYLLMKFPPPKQTNAVPIRYSVSLIKDGVLILIAFFLFCQSSFEAIINNWITTYLTSQLFIQADKALYALSLFVAGMTVMRLLLGSIFRNTDVKKIWIGSFSLVLLGLIFLAAGKSFNPAVAGLILLGAGLAGGFPIMLGFVGNRYKEFSGTAFSLVLVIALLGNMIINYSMGAIAQTYGIRYLITVAFVELAVMLVLCIAILKKIKSDK